MTQYNYTPPAALLGASGSSENNLVASRKYPTRSEEWTITIAGTASDGTYSVDFQNLPGQLPNRTISVVRTGGTPATNDDLAAALETAIDADDDLRSLFTTSTSTNVVTVVQRERGSSFTLANDTAPGMGTLTSAQSVAGAQASLGLALGVVLSAAGEIRLPTTGDTAFDGVTKRNDTNINMLPVAGVDASVDDAFDAGAIVPVLKRGTIWVEAQETVVAGDPVSIRIDGGGTVGGFNTTADANRIAVPGEYETAGAVGDLVLVRLNLPA